MAVTSDDVKRMALLSNLELPDGEVDKLVADLTNILEHMEVLQNFELTGDRAGDQVSGMTLREDISSDSPREMMNLVGARAAVDGEAIVRDGFFLVPRLDSHE